VLSLLLALTLTATPDAAAEEVYLGNIGVTANLPESWTIPRWSDWDLDAVNGTKTIKVHVGATAWQLPVDQETSKDWAGLVAPRLLAEGKGHSNFTVVSSGVTEREGRRVATAEVTYKYEGKQDATLYQWTFPVLGQALHLTATGIGPLAAQAPAALETWMGALSIGKDAKPLPAERAVSAGAGFGSELPSDWRQPLDAEMAGVRKMVAKTGQNLDPESCWVGIQPYATGEASLLLACQVGVWLGKVDEHSFEGVDAELRAGTLKSFELPAAESVAHADRISFLYSAPLGEQARRVGITPYDQGLILTYALGPASKADALDAGIRAALQATTFTGESGGAHPVGLAAWLGYAAAYRPVLLVGAAAPVLIFFGLIFLLANKKKPNYDEI